ncbi:hypothetical protein BGZ72_002044, partial [Mortierella alpina]
MDMDEAGDTVIDVGDISTLTTIPNSSDVENACRMLAGRDDCVVRFNHDLTVKAGAVRALAQIHRTKVLAEALIEMQAWLASQVSPQNPEFIAWFQAIITQEPKIMVKTFPRQVHILSVLRFAKEQWIDDDAIRAVLDEYQTYYGNNSESLFITSEHLLSSVLGRKSGDEVSKYLDWIVPRWRDSPEWQSALD